MSSPAGTCWPLDLDHHKDHTLTRLRHPSPSAHHVPAIALKIAKEDLKADWGRKACSHVGASAQMEECRELALKGLCCSHTGAFTYAKLMHTLMMRSTGWILLPNVELAEQDAGSPLQRSSA